MMKLQSTIEFMLVISTFLVILISTVYISWLKFIEIENVKRDLEAEIVLNNIDAKLATVLMEGRGFKMNLTLPERIAGFDYTVRIDDHIILLNLSGKIYVKTTITENVTGKLKKGKNVVKNINGTIFIL